MSVKLRVEGFSECMVLGEISTEISKDVALRKEVHVGHISQR